MISKIIQQCVKFMFMDITLDLFFYPISHPECWVFVFQLSQGQKIQPWLFHDNQSSSGPTALTFHFSLHLIRSISVNHRVAMSTVTCRARFLQKPQSTPHPPQPLLNTHKPNPLTIFPIFPYVDALTIASITTLDGGVSCSITDSSPTFLFSLGRNIQSCHDLWLWVNLSAFLW